MENLSLDHKTTNDKVEKIEARQTTHENELIKFSKENSNIIRKFIDRFENKMNDIWDTKKNIDNRIEGFEIKLDSHIKVCADKQAVLNVSV